MGRLSRGCRRCRERRVRCDEKRPACDRCVNRNEVCEGYRDDAAIIFRHETEKVIELSRASQTATPFNPKNLLRSSKRRRSKSVETNPIRLFSSLSSDPSSGSLALEDMSTIKLENPLPWLKQVSKTLDVPVEEQLAQQFIEKLVIYPCNSTSSPGFLEHLPCMFKEVNIQGRYALRWAVQAAAYADTANSQDQDIFVKKALECYGLALEALGQSLALPGKSPDDYDLMTVVILDIFESLYMPNEVCKGSHAQGMAQLLRLRGADLLHSPRGWSLFRVAHHRIQKQQLTFNMPHVPELADLFNQLRDDEPFVRLERTTESINVTCKRARELLELIDTGGTPVSTIINTIIELHALDQEATAWRQNPQWSFNDLPICQRSDLAPAAEGITDTIQLHIDLWMAYEWNYHRAARIIFLEQLLRCANAAIETPGLEELEALTLSNTICECTSTVQWLAHEILATVPQSLGDVDHMGRLHNSNNGPPRCRTIGGYLLLWPTRIVKADTSVTTQEQKKSAWRVFERIREYTGMKAAWGSKSIV